METRLGCVFKGAECLLALLSGILDFLKITGSIGITRWQLCVFTQNNLNEASFGLPLLWFLVLQ